MSRYVVWTDNENLEVFVGFDEGIESFFLTIADARTCTGEAGSYLFHNIDHHPGVGMTIGEVTSTAARFGLELPSDLKRKLAEDARQYGAQDQTCSHRPNAPTPPPEVLLGNPEKSAPIQVLGWET